MNTLSRILLYKKNIVPLSLLFLLSGCDWFGSDRSAQGMTMPVDEKELQDAAVEVLTEGISVIDKDELTGEVLLLLDGKPVVTTDSLATERKKIFEANPQLEQIFAYVDPAQLDRNIAEGLLSQAIIDRYIGEKGIDKTSDYKKELKEGIKAIERMVNTKFFMQNLPVTITDANIRTFYEENKNQMPELISTRGGIKASGVQFDSEDAARTFAAQVVGNDLKKTAETQNMSDKVRDFGMVHQQSMNIDKDLKEKVLALDKFPSTQVIVLSPTNVWVVSAMSKEETKYAPFEQVKDRLKEYMEKDERSKKFEEEMAALKKRYNVEVKGDFLTAPEGEGDLMLDDAMLQDLAFDDVEDTVALYESEQDQDKDKDII